jgi:hypothetical protein
MSRRTERQRTVAAVALVEANGYRVDDGGERISGQDVIAVRESLDSWLHCMRCGTDRLRGAKRFVSSPGAKAAIEELVRILDNLADLFDLATLDRVTIAALETLADEGLADRVEDYPCNEWGMLPALGEVRT